MSDSRQMTEQIYQWAKWSLGHYPWGNKANNITPLTAQRGIEKKCLMIFLQRTRMDHCQFGHYWNCFKGSSRETSETTWNTYKFGFSTECVNTVFYCSGITVRMHPLDPKEFGSHPTCKRHMHHSDIRLWNTSFDGKSQISLPKNCLKK